MGKPRQGKELKRVTSIRLEPRIIKMIIEQYGSLSEFISEAVAKMVKGASK